MAFAFVVIQGWINPKQMQLDWLSGVHTKGMEFARFADRHRRYICDGGAVWAAILLFIHLRGLGVPGHPSMSERTAFWASESGKTHPSRGVGLALGFDTGRTAHNGQ